MKIEKLRSKLKKAFNRVMGVLLPVATLFVSCGTNLLMVHAVESNSFHVAGTFVRYENGKIKEYEKKEMSITPVDGYEALACPFKVTRANEIIYYNMLLMIRNTKTNKYGMLGNMKDFCTNVGSYTYSSNGVDYYTYTMDESYQDTVVCRSGDNPDYVVENFSISGNIKVFKDQVSLEAYVASGDTSGMIELDKDIDDGVKDPDIGYLHNLQRNSLQSGKQDENGIYEKYSARFTWDDTYPEYDSSYLVEVRGKCAVQTRGFLGFGKTKNYTSDIKNIAKDISYKDLEWIISSQDQYAPFNSFINEHMPTNLVMTGVYGMRDYYFRIYKWSDTDECYHYGPWVNMHYIDDDLWISNVQESTVGDFDDNGNFIVNPDSDYGTGTKKSDGVGVGDTEEDAKKDNDKREEEKKNDDGKLDLSNASISDIWYWFVTSLSNLYNSLGFIPEFFQKIFSFLPTPIYVFLGIGIVVAILLRVLGR